MPTSDSYEDLAKKLKLIDEQNKQLNSAAKILIERDFELRQAYGELEKEKEQVSAERNKLAVVISGVADGVIATDLKTNIVTFNEVAEQLTGYKEEEVLDKPIDQIIKLFDDQQELISSVFCPTRTDGFEGVVFSQQNLKLLGKNNKEAFVNLLSSQIKEGPSVNLGCILTLHDITKEKQLEKMKLDFVSMAAHELRTPLTALQGYLSVFTKEANDKLNPEQQEFLQRINNSTQELMQLAENLLDVSNVEHHNLTINPKPTNWINLVKNTVQEFMSRAQQKTISLIFKEPVDNLPPIFIDPMRMREVISNLLSNAITYTPNGGQITVTTDLQNNTIVTSINDTGVGISKEDLPKLFHKFFRVVGKFTRDTKGTGLGLYIAKMIIDAHKGNIWAESEVGKGSTFSFSIPLPKTQNST